MIDLKQVKQLSLPKIEDDRGNLTFIQEQDQIPFKVERVFWTYNVPGGEQRGGHAYQKQQELIVALSGSIDVIITHKNGLQETYSLNRSYNALYIPPNTWRHIQNHSTNAVSLHLSSHKFDANDYIRNINDLL